MGARGYYLATQCRLQPAPDRSSDQRQLELRLCCDAPVLHAPLEGSKLTVTLRATPTQTAGGLSRLLGRPLGLGLQPPADERPGGLERIRTGTRGRRN